MPLEVSQKDRNKNLKQCSLVTQSNAKNHKYEGVASLHPGENVSVCCGKNTDAIETVEKNPIRETEGTCQIEYNENSLGEIQNERITQTICMLE